VREFFTRLAGVLAPDPVPLELAAVQVIGPHVSVLWIGTSRPPSYRRNTTRAVPSTLITSWGPSREERDRASSRASSNARRVYGYILKTRPGQLELPASRTRYARRVSAMRSEFP